MSPLNVLRAIEQELPLLLQDETKWKGVDVTYHPPRVERLWQQWGSYRIYLHRVHPCTEEEALLHPHPWPQAVKVLSGRYEMGIGVSPDLIAPPIVCRTTTEGVFEYEMDHPHGWHYVRPLEGSSMSIMVTLQPWEREVIKSSNPLPELGTANRAELLQFFRERYPA
ncbi:MAG: hypothetical protein ACAH35_05100 [Candidatus Paceibacterota bacterium]